jgi:glycine/D-amino acid oxidase-like deaminating enzyme
MQPANDAEVLIIGGGIAGVATAYHLARYGCQVTLLERGEIASEASGVNSDHHRGLGLGPPSQSEFPPYYGEPGDFQKPATRLGL